MQVEFPKEGSVRVTWVKQELNRIVGNKHLGFSFSLSGRKSVSGRGGFEKGLHVPFVFFDERIDFIRRKTTQEKLPLDSGQYLQITHKIFTAISGIVSLIGIDVWWIKVEECVFVIP